MAQTSNDQSKQNNQKNQGSNKATEDLREVGMGNNASATRGGTTDMDEDSTLPGNSGTERGSGMATKRNVTGSDFDGQTSI